MRALYIYFFAISVFFVASCNNSKTNEQERKVEAELIERAINPKNATYQVEMTGIDTAQFKQYYTTRITPPAINLNQPLENKSISELELLKNTLFAMKGKIFKHALYSAYFDTVSWYQPPFWDDNYTVTLNEDEQWFVDRVSAQVSDLQTRDYTEMKMPNPENLVNAFQWKNIYFNDQLARNGFFFSKTDYNQAFEIYEQNALENIPSFVTTDLIMHQMHMFYGMLENEIEEKYLTDKLQSMLEAINIELYASYEKTLDSKIEQAIEENLLYYSIPYAVITGKKTNLIGSYSEQYVDELSKVLSANGTGSKIMNDSDFDYAIFKPRQHYTKNEKITKYYKALTWLQKISLCLNDEAEFNKAIIAAYIINKSEALKNEYKEYVELKTYFSSQKEQFTLWDLANIISKVNDIKLFEDLFKNEIQLQIKESLGIEDQEECQLTVSLMPIEYQNRFTDLNEITNNNPKASSIDLFAALSNPAALEIFNENTSIESKQQYLTSITENLVNISSQEDARSMDWLSTLLTSFNENTQDQQYMSTSPWKRKELNAAVASWILLNQRVNLSTQSTKNNKDLNSGDGVMQGYVEPNRAFWKAAITLLNNTKSFLFDRKMLSEKSNQNFNNFMELVHFLDSISKKELSGIPITDQDFNRISNIGTECHNLTLQLINAKLTNDKFKIRTHMAYATKVNNSKGKNLIAGIGSPACIFSIVEINGMLYLVKGAVYSYYEIPDYPRRSIGQSEWRKSIGDGLQPVEWIQSLYLMKRDASILAKQ